MPYRIKRNETLRKATRRIAAEQIGRARDELCGGEPETAEAVHQARKRFKKLRSLLRLIRPVMQPKIYRAGNRFFRDQGRVLATARDDQVMIDTLSMLTGDGHATIAHAELATLREMLLARRDVHLEGGENDLARRMSGVAVALEQYRARLADWDLSNDGFDALRPGLQHSYRRGRKAMQLAARQTGNRDTRMHEWRKRVKDHWYHSRLLQGLWPGMMKPYSSELKRLSDLLGDDHDLAVFRKTLETLDSEALADGTRTQLTELVAAQQQQLRREALDLGQRVYAEKPKRLRKRWQAWWLAWQDAA